MPSMLAPGLPHAGVERGRGDTPARPGAAPRGLGQRHRLLHSQGAHLRLPARPAGAAAPAQRAARPRAPPRKPVRPSRRGAVAARAVDGAGGRGRQHPDRRGAHAADPVAAARQPAASSATCSRALRSRCSWRRDAISGWITPTQQARADRGRPRPAGAAAPSALGGLWQDRRHRDEIVSLALVAHHLLFRDQHYLVRDRKILMIDQTTGRVAPGRVWSRGLQQLLEAKEGCPPSGEHGDDRADHLPALLSRAICACAE